MRSMTILLVVVASIFLCFPPALLGEGTTTEGVLLDGRYIGPEEEGTMEPVGQEAAEDGGWVDNVSALEDLPVIEPDLMDQARQMDPMEFIRVIIFLDYQPHDVIDAQVREEYASEIESIRQEARAINARFAQERRLDFPTDSENYESSLLEMRQDEKEAMRDLNERNEALALTMHQEIAAKLNPEIESYQASAKADIQQLGGEVEFGTTAGNAVIARVPAGSVEAIAGIDHVARVVGDRLMEQHLNIADDATKVSYGGTGGLWGSGNTGGIYDPAVLDSGTDLDHPGLEDNTDRENYWSWYLVAASGHPLYNDYFGIDDRNGHGTHVMGIVGSYGTTSYPNHLGMSYGVEKAVHLKAGFHRSDGGGSMYWSDAMWLVDRALYHTEDLQPWNSFNDDVDGFNLSYGGLVATDETDFTRFWDSVVSSYADTVVTISAGNDGPSNTDFSDPGSNYNAITVANVDDRNTASRDDDIIRSSSTRGPTANGRRKPDIAAPGTYISSCNTFWETQADYINKSGTSMSAPMILGLAMDLMDAGVLDEKEIKALLINNAQKNEPGIDFESDADGWSTAFGWGYVNAWAAYYHRADVDSYTVTERNTAGDYILLSGQMRDEGSTGEGRDRVTMVWNRHATYNPHAYPTTYYALSDLNLRLYRETDNYLFDSDLDFDDNVHQVRINSGASATDVVVKAYAWSTNFAHGGATESFALATEENFVEVELPSTFQGIGSWRSEVEPNEEFDVEFWLRNDSDIASHTNEFKLLLPVGWTRVSGTETQSVGSIAGEGGLSSHVEWRVRAQATPQDGVSIRSQHTHNSYAESWGPYNWGMGTNVRWDTTPPTPNPMTWATEPYEISTSQIRMVATTANDLHAPVQYHFWRYLTAGGGSTDLGYYTNPTFTDSGRATNTQYRYWVRARDNATNPNYTSYSAYSDEYSGIETPTGITFGSYGSTYINARSTNTPSGLTRGSSGLIIYNVTRGTNSSWKQNNDYWYSGSLTPNTPYAFRAMARNGDAGMTAYSNYYYRRTLANAPGAGSFSDVTQTSIQANWTANGNPAGTEYYCQNITAGTNSGWTTNTNWNSTGLNCGTPYSFRVMARNAEGYGTAWAGLGIRWTLACDYDPPVIDDIAFDNCISECPTCPDSAITVADHDPEGGILTYYWQALDGGNIIGSGSSVFFDPPDTGPHVCPYRVKVTITSSVSGLTDDATIGIFVKLTGDVDGNGVVNVIDKVQVRNHFGESGSPGWIPADVNCNGVVNVLDKVKVRNQFGDSGCSCP